MSVPVLSRILLRAAWPQTHGEIAGLALHGSAEVLRDQWGIPHIYARDEHDLFFCQGFVHAQDRLWQMESLRRLSEGRLSEIVGEKTLSIDTFARMMGFPEMKRRAFACMPDDDRARLDAYSEGVNALLSRQGRRLPLELRSMGVFPEPWKPADCVSVLPILSWSLNFLPYAAKLLAIARGRALSASAWNDLFASYPGAHPASDGFFDGIAGLRFGEILPGALAFHDGLPDVRSASGSGWEAPSLGAAGSNAWTVRGGPGGLPMLANDPHLGVNLPSIWYFCHLCVPGLLNAAGASIASSPGIVIGRNEHVAWGLTNLMLDAVDIVAYRLDPSTPTRYRLGAGFADMDRQDLVIGLPGGKSVSVPVYRTEAGPVITAVERGTEAAAAVRWYGTLPAGAIDDQTMHGTLSLMRAQSVGDVFDAARGWKCVGQSFKAADDTGAMGWHASGAVPLRTGGGGRLPVDGSAGARWAGFLPFDGLPRCIDPSDEWIATANNRPPFDGDADSLGSYWCAPYRYERIAAVLSAMDAPRADAFRALQCDVHSLQADRILPKVLAYPLSEREALRAARILGEWDHEMRTDSPGAALYEVFISELNRELLGGRLGKDLALFYNARLYGVEDVIFDRLDSPLWLDQGASTPAWRAKIVERALAASIRVLEKRLGRGWRRWRWGRLHRFAFPHPGADNPLLARLLNPDSLPASGDCCTVNANAPRFADGSYTVSWMPSMRMIVPVGDIDGMRVIDPLGQSGQPGHPHYEDLSARWAENDQVPLPLSRPAVERIARDRLVLG